MSQPPPIRLFSVLLISAVACMFTGLGGWFLHHQQIVLGLGLLTFGLVIQYKVVSKCVVALTHCVKKHDQAHAHIQALTHANMELNQALDRHKAREEELRTLASLDSLTGLANRAFVLPHARQRIAQAQREHKNLGLMLLDFDHFKPINDTYGHAVGDEVLHTMAQRLLLSCRDADVLARLGGDEFLLVFEGFRNAAEVELIGRRLMAQFQTPAQVGALRLPVGISIGVALYPQHGQDLEMLLAAADVAMYAAKQNGGGLCFAQASTPD